MLTRKQHELLSFLHQRLQESDIAPSFEEMKDALGLKSKSGVHRLVNALEERGFIRRLANRARALEVTRPPLSPPPLAGGEKTDPPLVGAPFAAPRLPVVAVSRTPANDVVDIPLHGQIAAGLPIEALESDRSLSLPAAMLGTGFHFALEVSGDSMCEAGILDGDYAIIRQGEQAHDGDIVVALVDQEDATLKTLRRKNGLIELEPANKNYTIMRFEPTRVNVQGKLVGLLRRYH